MLGLQSPVEATAVGSTGDPFRDAGKAGKVTAERRTFSLAASLLVDADNAGWDARATGGYKVVFGLLRKKHAVTTV